MPRTLRWPLAFIWVALGAAAGVALADPFTRWSLLLVPVGLVAVLLLWQVEGRREVGAALIGLVSWPLLVIPRVLDPACPTGGAFPTCDPGVVWPWVVLAVLLVVGGALVVRAGSPRGVSSPAR